MGMGNGSQKPYPCGSLSTLPQGSVSCGPSHVLLITICTSMLLPGLRGSVSTESVRVSCRSRMQKKMHSLHSGVARNWMFRGGGCPTKPTGATEGWWTGECINMRSSIMTTQWVYIEKHAQSQRGRERETGRQRDDVHLMKHCRIYAQTQNE